MALNDFGVSVFAGVTVSFFPRPNLPPGEETDRLVSSPGKKPAGWFLPLGKKWTGFFPPPPSPFLPPAAAGSADYICVKDGGKSNKIAV